MPRWTLEDLRNYQNRQKRSKTHPGTSLESSETNFGGLIGIKPPPPIAACPRPILASRSTTDEGKLNKTEGAYLAVLRAQGYHVWIQAWTLKLADDCRLTVDFVYLNERGELVFVDVKGFQREDALIKMKVAARIYNLLVFQIVKKNGSGWDIDVIKP